MKYVLLDRDGTLIVDPPNERVLSKVDIKLFPDTISALKMLSDKGYEIIIITNQAAVSEGLMTEPEFWDVHREVLNQFGAKGIKILKTYVCLHGPDSGCACRKPKPTMLEWAAKEFGFELADTFMVGDRPSDVLSGKNAGAKSILVQTATNKQESAPDADFVANNLTEAVDTIIANS